MQVGTVLQIEPTDLCNLACPMCTPQICGGDVHEGLRPGFMDLDLYGDVVADLARHRFELDHLIFQWLGEPTLHPKLEEMVALAGRELRGLVNYLRIDTNAVALTPSRTDSILASRTDGGPPILLVFSLDAATPETYLAVKGRDRYHQVMANIRHFLARRGELGSDDPGVNTQFQFVLQAHNQHEAGRFVALCDELLLEGRNGIGFNEVMIKRVSIGTGGEQQRLADETYDRVIAEEELWPRDDPHLHLRVWAERTWGEDSPADEAAPAVEPEAETPRPREGRVPCPAPWKTPVIRWDGQLMTCCADTDGAIEVGNVADGGFVALWNGPRMTEIRLAHLLGDLSPLPYCQACGGFTWYEMPADEIRAYLEGIDRLDLWPRVAGRLGFDAG